MFIHLKVKVKRKLTIPFYKICMGSLDFHHGTNKVSLSLLFVSLFHFHYGKIRVNPLRNHSNTKSDCTKQQSCKMCGAKADTLERRNKSTITVGDFINSVHQLTEQSDRKSARI
jgi:hypothetical protein